MFYDLYHNNWNEEEMKAILRTLRSGTFTMGEAVAQYESQFAVKFGAKYALMVNSGSSANLLSVAALFHKKDRPLKRGDEVIVPALAHPTSYFPLQQYGLKFKFVDVEIDTLNLDPTQLERALTPKTRMVLAVNVLGNPCSLDAIKNFCKRNNLYLFEDNCEAMGAEFKGIKCGMWGDIGTFSTNPSSHMSTMEGGMIVTDDKELYHIAKSMRDYGSTQTLPPESPAFQGRRETKDGHSFLFPGYNLRPLELSGAIGAEQLKKFDSNLEVRRQNACLLQDLLKEDDRFLLQRENSKSSWLGFSVVLNPGWPMERQKVLSRLRDEGIEFALITGGNILNQDVMKHIDHEFLGDVKVARLIHDRGFFVGNHPQDLTRQIERFHKVLVSLPRFGTQRKAA